jgi:putative PIN family toxin of toxin-antitoxin system
VTGVTADTNIYISGLEFGGLPRHFLDLARAGAFRLDISGAILNEILRVLRVKFSYSPDALQSAEEKIRNMTQYVNPLHTVDVIKSDPSDNRILECAIAAKSDFVVTGDTRHLLPLGSFAGIKILQVAEFLELLKHGTPL